MTSYTQPNIISMHSNAYKWDYLGQFAVQNIKTWQADSSTGNTPMVIKNSVPMATHSFPVPTHLIPISPVLSPLSVTQRSALGERGSRNICPRMLVILASFLANRYCACTTR